MKKWTFMYVCSDWYLICWISLRTIFMHKKYFAFLIVCWNCCNILFTIFHTMTVNDFSSTIKDFTKFINFSRLNSFKYLNQRIFFNHDSNSIFIWRFFTRWTMRKLKTSKATRIRYLTFAIEFTEIASSFVLFIVVDIKFIRKWLLS